MDRAKQGTLMRLAKSMPKLDWAIIILVVFIALGSYPVASQEINGAKTNDTDGVKASKMTPVKDFALPVRIVEHPLKSAADERSEAESAQREKDDLVAQQTVADYTRYLFQINFIQLFLSVVGTIALLWSIMLNRRATNAAVEATNAAREAMGLERAWLVCSSINHEIHTNVRDERTGVIHPDAIAFSVGWLNVGRSPALKVQPYINSQIADFDADPPTFEKRPHADGGNVVGPGVPSGETGKCYLTGAAYTAFMNRTSCLFLHSYVYYRDTFNPTVWRQSEICVKLVFRGNIVDQRDGSVQIALGSAYVGPQNTAA